MSPVIACLDMDAFFASVEQRDDPALRGKPVIVGTGPRAVVEAASYEARPFGIHSAMPVTQARRLCPQAVFLSGHHHRYSEISRDIFAMLERYSPDVRQVSIDEGFLDITGCELLFGRPEIHAKKIQEAVWNNFQLSCSLGVAPNRLAAKMASNYRKPKGLTVFETEEEAAKAFAPLPVEKITGVGPKMQEHLNRLGIVTIGDLAAYPASALKDQFGAFAATLIQAARGHAQGAWWGEDRDEKNKSVGHSLTFETDTRDLDFLGKVLLMLSEQVSRRLREDNLVAKRITVTLRFSDFKTITRAALLPAVTSDPFTIYGTALKVLKEQDLRPKPLRLLGVTAKDLEDEGSKDQLVLFDDGGQKKKPLFLAMDKLKEKYGEDAVQWGTLAEKKEGGKKVHRRGAFNPFSKPKDK